jgi:ATP-dependent exoDNAse (exonuclease V) beta subunit
MSVHRAKGLEFGVVAVPHLDRNLLTGTWPPLLTFGRGEDRQVGMQLRRLGARSINLFDHEALREETQRRDAAEALRLFHVAATRARERLILSGVVREKAPRDGLSVSVLERIVAAFEVDRGADSEISVAAPSPRPGLETSFAPSHIAVRVNRSSAERAAELVALRPTPAPASEATAGPAPLLDRRAPAVPNRPFSYSAISAYEDCGYRFMMERVFGVPPRGGGWDSPGIRSSAPVGADGGAAAGEESLSPREERTARGAAVHALLEWSQEHGWAEPPPELIECEALAAGLSGGKGEGEDLLEPLRRWLGSSLRSEIEASATGVRAEVPILLGVGETVLRGSIDLLVEREGAPPLVLDYKTDRLAGAAPAERAGHYATQRAIYALAVAEALDAEQVEVAYVFLEQPEAPVLSRLGGEELGHERRRLAETIERINAGRFEVAPASRRDWGLCRGCPALGNLCSGPEHA